MAFKQRFREPLRTVALGQLSLWAGVLIRQAVLPRLPRGMLSGPAGGAFENSLYLMSGVLIGLSVVLNLHGIHVYRRKK